MTSSDKGNLFVISGPSGAGKGTLVGKLQGRLDDMWLSISATTRQPRKGEIEGVHYYFKTDDEFDELIATGGLLEWANVHGKRYGTPRAPVEQHVAAGYRVILEIEPQGAFQVRKSYPEAILIFIVPPSFDDLYKRLVKRGTEDAQQIERRLTTARMELQREKEYDVTICNDDVETATDRLVEFIESR